MLPATPKQWSLREFGYIAHIIWHLKNSAALYCIFPKTMSRFFWILDLVVYSFHKLLHSVENSTQWNLLTVRWMQIQTRADLCSVAAQHDDPFKTLSLPLYAVLNQQVSKFEWSTDLIQCKCATQKCRHKIPPVTPLWIAVSLYVVFCDDYLLIM